MGKTLTSRERLIRHLQGQEVDRLPAIGGWTLGVSNLADLAGISENEYLADPLAGVVRANQRLQVDAMVPPIVPTDPKSIRSGALEESGFTTAEPEDLLLRAEKIPDSAARVLEGFDATATEQRYREYLEPLIEAMGDIAMMTTIWEATANFALYFQYGYEAFLAAIALYPDAVERIFWEDSVLARARNQVIVRLMQEYQSVPILFTGHDICTNQGPMCSPIWLHDHYWPHARYSLEPYVEQGMRVVGHCDGDVRPLVDDMIGAGFSGFQGFQYECEVHPYDLWSHSTPQGPAILFGGLSVSRTLPLGSPEDVRQEVDFLIRSTGGGQRMFLFSSNVTGVEVPPDNIRAAYGAAAAYKPSARPAERMPWPWLQTHPE